MISIIIDNVINFVNIIFDFVVIVVVFERVPQGIRSCQTVFIINAVVSVQTLSFSAARKMDFSVLRQFVTRYYFHV